MNLSGEKKLVHKLLEAYLKVGRTGRPIRDVTKAVPVEFGLGLIKMEVEEHENILSISAWTRYVSTTTEQSFMSSLPKLFSPQITFTAISLRNFNI